MAGCSIGWSGQEDISLELPCTAVAVLCCTRTLLLLEESHPCTSAGLGSLPFCKQQHTGYMEVP